MINTTLPHSGTNFLILQIAPNQLIVGGGYNKDTEIFYKTCYFFNVETHELTEAPALPFANEQLLANSIGVYSKEMEGYFMLQDFETDGFHVVKFELDGWKRLTSISEEA
jgi:hypothetical protein